MKTLPRVRVSPNRRFLETETGQPFFWLGDTAWELFHRLSPVEIETYLEKRARQGFNVIQAVALAEFGGLTVPNAQGNLPLVDLDPARPNEAYFALVDKTLAMAADKGLYIGLLPTWGDKVNKMWGAGPVVFDENSAHAYGAWLGRRYRDAANLIWILGGDRPESDPEGRDYRPVWRAMAAGIRAGVNGPAFMTYHPCGRSGSSVAFHEDDWLDLNMWQSGHRQLDYPNWEMITSDYGRSPTRPTLDGEPNYEDHPVAPWPTWNPASGYFRDHDVRKAAYRAVFSGACGHTYGHHSIWQFYDPARREPVNHPWCAWQEALDRPGAAQMRHLRELIEARPYFSRIPDQSVLVSPEGSGGEKVRATRDSAGSYLMVYLPTPYPVSVYLGSLREAQARARWFDPRLGAYHEIGMVSTREPQAFTPPAWGVDWVLVVDC